MDEYRHFHARCYPQHAVQETLDELGVRHRLHDSADGFLYLIIYPFQRFNVRKWAIHLFETLLKIACYWALLVWAQKHGVLGKTLEVWLVPVFIFSLFNSIRFIAEHYETPWNQGQLLGSRTVTSNPLHSFFWNNINWHIGHHIYPSVPWYNLIELHDLMKPAIAAEGAIVEKSYTGVFLRALVRGPESEQRLERVLEKRRPVIA